MKRILRIYFEKGFQVDIKVKILWKQKEVGEREQIFSYNMRQLDHLIYNWMMAVVTVHCIAEICYEKRTEMLLPNNKRNVNLRLWVCSLT